MQKPLRFRRTASNQKSHYNPTWRAKNGNMPLSTSNTAMAVVRESNPMSKSTQFTTFQTVFLYSFSIYYHILPCLSTVCANLPLQIAVLPQQRFGMRKLKCYVLCTVHKQIQHARLFRAHFRVEHKRAITSLLDTSIKLCRNYGTSNRQIAKMRTKIKLFLSTFLGF